MNSLLLIPSCFLAGLLSQKLRRFPEATAHALNAFVVQISLPALVLAKFSPFARELTLGVGLLIPISMAWLNFVVAWIVFSKLGSLRGWSRSTTGALILTAGLGNTSFVGFPMLVALIGPEALPIGILVDQPGSFLVLGTLGVTVAALFSGKKVTGRAIVGRVFGFPPFLALCLSVTWATLGLPGATQTLAVLEPLSATLVPLALFSVGFQFRLNLKSLQQRAAPLGAALLFKLLLAPAFFSFFYLKLLGNTGFSARVTVLESAMAPMITSAVVATEFGLDSELANWVVSLGILLSFGSVPLWIRFLP